MDCQHIHSFKIEDAPSKQNGELVKVPKSGGMNKRQTECHIFEKAKDIHVVSCTQDTADPSTDDSSKGWQFYAELSADFIKGRVGSHNPQSIIDFV